MNIDMGYLGKVVIEPHGPFEYWEEGFTVVGDGYTESGVRVHTVIDDASWRAYPSVWNNAILIKVE